MDSIVFVTGKFVARTVSGLAALPSRSAPVTR
jgi:hypothetical protein